VSQAGRAHLGHERETESDLLLRVRAGDMEAFGELAERNEGPALAVAKGIVDHATAEDVVADSIERLLVLLKRGEGPTYCVRPYFLQMVRNRAIDYHRRTVEIPVDVAESRPALTAVPDEIDSAVVRSAFEALPERWQAALWMGVVESRSHAEIGRELDVAEGAASQLLHRAREGLRQSYLDAQVGTAPDCTELSGLVGKYVRERCSRRDARKVDAHLAACPDCRDAVAKSRQLNSRIGAVLAVGVLGGVGLELLKQPGTAMAAELGGLPARAIQSVKVGGKARHFALAAAGVVIAAGLVVGLPANGADLLADAIFAEGSAAPTPSLSLTPTPTPSLTPTPTPTPSATPTDQPTTAKPTTAKPRPTPSKTPSPTPVPPPTPTPTPTPEPCPEIECPIDPPPQSPSPEVPIGAPQ